MNQYLTKDGDMIDAICFAYYGSGMVEKVYEANRDLAEYGPELPAGLTINLPDAEPATAPKLTRLWE